MAVQVNGRRAESYGRPQRPHLYVISNPMPAETGTAGDHPQLAVIRRRRLARRLRRALRAAAWAAGFAVLLLLVLDGLAGLR